MRSPRSAEVKSRHVLMAVVTLGIGDLLLPPLALIRVPACLLTAALVLLFARESWAGLKGEASFARGLKPRWPDLAVLGVTALFGTEKIVVGIRLLEGVTAASENAFRLYATIFVIGAVLKTFFRSDVAGIFLSSLRLRPPQTMLISYVSGMVLGALLLVLPQAVVSLEHVSMIDALFTSTSALCVTGLVVNNVGETYTFFGQAVILVLMQAGGFGIMFFATFFVLLFTETMSFRKDEEMRDMMGTDARAPIHALVRRVFALSLTIEIAGAVLLFLRFAPEHGNLKGAWLGVFHSVSGFCNAGFCLFPDSLSGYAGSLTVNAIVMGLVLMGGLGVPVLDDLRRWTGAAIRRAKPPGISLHTKLVLLASGILTGAGAVAFLLLEYGGALRDLGAGGKVLAAVFQSTCARTAGFNTVDLAECRSATIVILMALMFVGGAPASTAGGLKVTVLAVLFLAFRSALSNREEITAFNRRIPGVMINKSLALLAASLIVFGVLLELLLLAESAGFRGILFEMVSAFNTVGWSLGVTRELGYAGKAIVTAAMLIGRIGPLTLAVALARAAKPSRYTYPSGSVLIG